MAIYDFSSLLIRTAQLQDKPYEVLKEEAKKSPRARAEVFCLWLPEDAVSPAAEPLQHVDDWISDFRDCISPHSEFSGQFSYMPRLGVAAAHMPEHLKERLSRQRVYIAVAENLNHPEQVADCLRHTLRAGWERLCNPAPVDYPADLRKYVRENVTEDEINEAMKGTPEAVRELLAPYQSELDKLKSEPREIA